MTAENAGAAEATPPDNVTETKTEVAAAPNSGAVSFSDYVKTLPEDLQQHATKKGWKDYGDAIKAHAAAESLIGNKVDLPKPGDDAALKAHMIKIGAPADGKYDLDYGAAEGVQVDEGLKGAFEAFLKDNPVPTPIAQNLVKFWNAAASQAAAAEAARIGGEGEAKQAALTEMQSELGKEKFEATMNDAVRAALVFGLPDDFLNRFEDKVGTKSFIEGFARIGAHLGTEDQFVDGHGRRGPQDAKDAATILYPTDPFKK